MNQIPRIFAGTERQAGLFAIQENCVSARSINRTGSE